MQYWFSMSAGLTYTCLCCLFSVARFISVGAQQSQCASDCVQDVFAAGVVLFCWLAWRPGIVEWARVGRCA